MTSPPTALPLPAPSHPDPYPLYAALRAAHPTGLHHDAAAGLWVASTAGAVSEALRHPALRVRPPTEPVPAALAGTPAGQVFGGLMRQTDGPVHAQGKAWVSTLLQRPWPVADAARAVVVTGASPRVRALDDLLFDAPLQVLWRLLHDGEAAPPQLAPQVRALIAGWSPSADHASRDAASHSASVLLPLLGHEANQLGLYTQTCEATAGLMGAVLVALQCEHGLRARWLADPALDEPLALEAARHDAPVQNTRRFCAEDTTLRGHHLTAGDAVLVLLASANRDPAANPEPDRFDLERRHACNLTWGLGGHACPGAALSRQMAMALLRAWHAEDAAGLERQTRRWHHRPSPNGRLPLFGAFA